MAEGSIEETKCLRVRSLTIVVVELELEALAMAMALALALALVLMAARNIELRLLALEAGIEPFTVDFHSLQRRPTLLYKTQNPQPNTHSLFPCFYFFYFFIFLSFF
ncbi:hypothetical protein TorRG33x02_038790 [Trema orientale]|uniref:Uncharacterized protein n=1 Tax=Trema orientale TaxID=63057 RepID=A0A2P5FRP2_TREOI|nr:hypothetical protein TorRG33x02_038790 [Trema orientale]